MNKGLPVKSVWVPSDSYENMSPIAQVYGVCFDGEGRILVIRHEQGAGSWNLPGGTPEKDETPEETLIREVDEEGDVDISKVKMLGAAEVFFENNPNKKKGDHYFQLRYVALIDTIKDQTPDPHNNKLTERKFIYADEFTKYIEWGDLSKAIIDAALKEKENL
jgi:8-oxo-dGTP diphosphatase